MIPFIFQDWQVNHGNQRSQLVLCLFRLAQKFHHLPSLWRWVGYPYFSFYEIFVVWILGIEISYKARIGPRLRLFHGIGTVIHEDVIIGSDVTLRHLTTIGTKCEGGKAPVLGNNINIGCNAIILGEIHIGNGATIGAGSVVLHSVADDMSVAGNPARIIVASNDRLNKSGNYV